MKKNYRILEITDDAITYIVQKKWFWFIWKYVGKDNKTYWLDNKQVPKFQSLSQAEGYIEYLIHNGK